MEGIKIWQLDGSRAVPLASANRLRSEQMLEEALVENPHLLIEGLTLVGRQTPTDGGPLDLLGVDQDGRLAVFELKRGTLSRDAVAQVIDYASHLDAMDLVDLAGHIAVCSGTHGIDDIEDFEEWYGQQFGDLESLKPLRLFLVGLGTDQRTERIVRFLAENSAMNISLLTFHGFDQDGKTLLAKQVEVSATDAAPSAASRSRSRSRDELRAKVDKKLDESNVAGLFGEVRSMFREHWPEAPHHWVTASGFSLRLKRPSKQWKAYARFDFGRDQVLIVFYARAIRLCRDEFKACVARIPYQTWKPNRDPLPEAEDEQPEIQFKVTTEVWGEHKERLTALVQTVYAAWLAEEA